VTELAKLGLVGKNLSPDETEIIFDQMGDPLLNPEQVVQAIKRLTNLDSSFRFVVSTTAPQRNWAFYKVMADLAKSAQIRLCFSCHTTSNLERRRLYPKMPMLILEEIADIVKVWPTPPVILSFIVMDRFTYDVARLAKLFSPDRVIIELNQLENNEFVRAQGLNNADSAQVEKFIADLTASGFGWIKCQ
jgi:adenine C2-methylase RlmN of 23S rRNA A2503 and tRNA A37